MPSYSLQLGQSLTSNDEQFHLSKFDFAPPSNQIYQSKISISKENEVNFNLEGNRNYALHYRGMLRSSNKDFIIIIDKKSMTATIEKVASNTNLKKVRATQPNISSIKKQNEPESGLKSNNSPTIPKSPAVQHTNYVPDPTYKLSKKTGIVPVKTSIEMIPISSLKIENGKNNNNDKEAIDEESHLDIFDDLRLSDSD